MEKNTEKSERNIVDDTHNALKKAVKDDLERKKKLGQYTVMWKEGKVVIEGDDAPKES